MKEKTIILNTRERKKIRQQLKEQFGVEKIPDKVYFCLNKKEKVFITNREVFEVDQSILRVNAKGLYFGTFMKDGFRLSVEGSQLIGKDATTHILELNTKQRDLWLRGEDVEMDVGKFDYDYVLLKNGKDFLGCGKAKGGKILNYLPKSRTMKNIVPENEPSCEC